MKSLTLLALGLTCLLAGNAWGQVRAGQPAPDFVAKTADGRSLRLSDYQGKIVVLEAYNPDCPFCANHYRSGMMQGLQAAVTSKGGVWLVIASAAPGQPGYRDVAAARKEFATQGMKATAWVDDSTGAIAKRYGIKTTPQMFVVDPQGKLAYQGAIDDRAASTGDPRTAKNYVKLAVESLLANRPVPVTETTPYGTPVKLAR